MAISITSWTDLINIVNDLAADYILTVDLDSSDVGYPATWIPLGDLTTKFTGTFDGGGFTISDLVQTTTNLDYVGLFGYTETGCSISNLTLSNIDFKGDDYVGGLVGRANNSTITNCSTSGLIDADSYTGGLVGYASIISVTSCSATCTLTPTYYYSGGLIGYSTGSTITSCSTITEILKDEDYMGGLIGYASSTNIITSYSDCNLMGQDYVGGLCGRMVNGSTATKSYSTGTVFARINYAGGISGDLANSGSITDSYSTCLVQSMGYRAGGIVGYMATSSVLENCYVIRPTLSPTASGALVGLKASGTVTNCFWDEDTSGMSTSDGGTSKTTALMKQEATFTSWDFTNDWQIVEDSDYPKLRNMTNATTTFTIPIDTVSEFQVETFTVYVDYEVKTVSDFLVENFAVGANLYSITLLTDFEVVSYTPPLLGDVAFSLSVLFEGPLSNVVMRVMQSGTFSTKPRKIKVDGVFIEKTEKVMVGNIFQ